MNSANNQFYWLNYCRSEVKIETKSHLKALFFKIEKKKIFKNELL